MTTSTTPQGDSPTVRPSRGCRHLGRALALMCVAACGLWAFMPLGPAHVDVPNVSASAASDRSVVPAALDVAAFNAPLWVAPAPPPLAVAEVTPPPLPPLKWQLLAIVREDTGYKALVYDPDTDRLLVLKEGDDSGPQRVERVTATTLDVRGGAGVRTLALREAAPGGRP